MGRKRKKGSRAPGATACVIGGGLAGMTVAKALTEHGVQVAILEASDHLGGKASAVEHDGRWEDHGYHIFPAWYANTRALLNSSPPMRNVGSRRRPTSCLSEPRLQSPGYVDQGL